MLRNTLLLLLVFLLACKNNPQLKKTAAVKPVILLQPLVFTDTTVLAFLKDSIEKFYPVNIVIAEPKQFPAHTYYQPRNRYRADSTIKWLKEIKPDSVRAIAGITNEDVSTTKSGYADFGVMGLGYKPGDACIISTYRLKKTAKITQHLRERLFKVTVHEMGHNFGLNHCTNETCIMVDAEEKMKLDKQKDLCKNCRNNLQL